MCVCVCVYVYVIVRGKGKGGSCSACVDVVVEGGIEGCYSVCVCMGVGWNRMH